MSYRCRVGYTDEICLNNNLNYIIMGHVYLIYRHVPFYSYNYFTHSLYTIKSLYAGKNEFLVNLWKDILNKPNTVRDNATRKSFCQCFYIDT